MNGRILRALLCKEALRHRASPGGLVLLLLVVVAALLLSQLLDGEGGARVPLPARACFVDYWHEDALLARLRENVPAELASRGSATGSACGTSATRRGWPPTRPGCGSRPISWPGSPTGMRTCLSW
jgi:hypothetical protein